MSFRSLIPPKPNTPPDFLESVVEIQKGTNILYFYMGFEAKTEHTFV